MIVQRDIRYVTRIFETFDMHGTDRDGLLVKYVDTRCCLVNKLELIWWF